MKSPESERQPEVRPMDTSASDKDYWHRYIDTYQEAFKALGPVTDILEFGVFNGGSIAWLAERFPGAGIVGVDIVPQAPEGPRRTPSPTSNWTRWTGASGDACSMLDRRCWSPAWSRTSHVPQHQATCLVEGLARVRSGGLYILEDIHTSHPDNPDFADHRKDQEANSLHVLLAIEHLASCNRPPPEIYENWFPPPSSRPTNFSPSSTRWRRCTCTGAAASPCTATPAAPTVSTTGDCAAGAGWRSIRPPTRCRS